jgi:hypothetical protein
MEVIQSRGIASRGGSGRGTNQSGFLQARQVRQKEGFGFAWLFLLAPLACCLGPLIVGSLAVASAATLGAVGGVIGGLGIGVAVLLILRHRRCSTGACSTLGALGSGGANALSGESGEPRQV